MIDMLASHLGGKLSIKSPVYDTEEVKVNHFSFSIHPIICLSFRLTMPLNEHIRHCNLIYRGIQLDIFSSLLVRRKKSLATQLSRRIVHIHLITFSDMFKMMNHINRKYWQQLFSKEKKILRYPLL